MKFKPFITLLILFLILAIFLLGYPEKIGEGPTTFPEIRFMAGYKAQTNLPFVGVYVAQEKGFYQAAGLKVTIQHSTGRGEHVQYLAAGKVDVITADAANVIQRRTVAGVPLVSIALIGQHGQQAFAALRSSEMTTIQDWYGKTIGFKGTPTFDLLALLKQNNLEIDDVELVNVGFDSRVLIEGLVDVYPVYKSNEPFLLASLGYPTTLWDPGELGIDTLGLSFVTSDQIFKEKGADLIIFLRATLQGIEYAAENQEEAIDIVLKYAGGETDREHMLYMLRTEIKDATTPMGYGFQDSERWRQLQSEMYDQGEIERLLPIEEFFNTSLWEKAQ